MKKKHPKSEIRNRKSRIGRSIFSACNGLAPGPRLRHFGNVNPPRGDPPQSQGQISGGLIHYIDLSGEQNDNGDTPKDIIQITVKPEYIIDNEESDEAQDVELDFTEDNSPIVEKKSVSEDDLNDLI